MLKITTSKKYGREVTATKRIKKGQVVVLSQNDTIAVNKTDLKFYTFRYNALQDCLCLGIAELFNHSENPNVTYSLVYDEVMGFLMEFKTLVDIKKGQQLFINYNYDVKVNTEEYNKNLY